MFYIRLVFITLIRFMAFIGLAVFSDNFDVTPLPTWTLIAFVYLVQFLLTYAATFWTYRKQELTKQKTITIALVFTLGEFILESSLFVFLTGSWSQLWQSYSWKVIFLFMIYVAAVALSVYQLKQMRRKALAPEGMNV